MGLGVDDIVRNVSNAGFDPSSVQHIVLTHPHIGHSGGANELRAMTGARIWAPLRAEEAMRGVENDAAIRINFEFGRYPDGFTASPCLADNFLAMRKTLLWTV
jgi:glyoxylase-like metal-dependent hydrolase (beta-lactamase superfamily II)